MGMQGGDPLELEKLEKLKKHRDLKVEELEILKNELKMKRTWQVQPALGRRLVGWVISLCWCLWTVTENKKIYIYVCLLSVFLQSVFFQNVHAYTSSKLFEFINILSIFHY